MDDIVEETEVTLINDDTQAKVRTSSVRSKMSSIEESLENLGKIRPITPRPSLTIVRAESAYGFR